MRRVRILAWNEKKEALEKTAHEGTFHAWSRTTDHDGDTFACAIVEMDNGQVRTIPADMIQFVPPLREYMGLQQQAARMQQLAGAGGPPIRIRRKGPKG